MLPSNSGVVDLKYVNVFCIILIFYHGFLNAADRPMRTLPNLHRDSFYIPILFCCSLESGLIALTILKSLQILHHQWICPGTTKWSLIARHPSQMASEQCYYQQTILVRLFLTNMLACVISAPHEIGTYTRDPMHALCQLSLNMVVYFSTKNYFRKHSILLFPCEDLRPEQTQLQTRENIATEKEIE